MMLSASETSGRASKKYCAADRRRGETRQRTSIPPTKTHVRTARNEPFSPDVRSGPRDRGSVLKLAGRHLWCGGRVTPRGTNSLSRLRCRANVERRHRVRYRSVLHAGRGYQLASFDHANARGRARPAAGHDDAPRLQLPDSALCGGWGGHRMDKAQVTPLGLVSSLHWTGI